MQKKYCPNLYWNLFLTRLTIQTPRKTKGYRTHVDGEQGELYNELKRTDALVSFGVESANRQRTETTLFPLWLFSHLNFCSKSSHSPGFKGGELPWAGEGVVL